MYRVIHFLINREIKAPLIHGRVRIYFLQVKNDTFFLRIRCSCVKTDRLVENGLIIVNNGRLKKTP
jgi:hypothetical protein